MTDEDDKLKDRFKALVPRYRSVGDGVFLSEDIEFEQHGIPVFYSKNPDDPEEEKHHVGEGSAFLKKGEAFIEVEVELVSGRLDELVERDVSFLPECITIVRRTPEEREKDKGFLRVILRSFRQFFTRKRSSLRPLLEVGGMARTKEEQEDGTIVLKDFELFEVSVVGLVDAEDDEQ